MIILRTSLCCALFDARRELLDVWSRKLGFGVSFDSTIHSKGGITHVYDEVLYVCIDTADDKHTIALSGSLRVPVSAVISVESISERQRWYKHQSHGCEVNFEVCTASVERRSTIVPHIYGGSVSIKQSAIV